MCMFLYRFNIMAFNPSIWGPRYWFVLQSIALCYPPRPNDVIKKKYYDFIQNLPLFIPHKEIGNDFIEILDKFPVAPYLDSRQSFLKWMNFVHNKINMKMGEPIIELSDGIQKYYDYYKPKELQNTEELRLRRKLIYGSVIGLALIGGYILYQI